jgi:cyanate permease
MEHVEVEHSGNRHDRVIITSPRLLGLCRDLSGSYTADWIVLAALLLAAVAATRPRRV